jgi:hypothetical protein
MAIMVKVHERGTDFKKNYRNDLKITTKKIRYWLIASVIINLGTIGWIVHHFLKK